MGINYHEYVELLILLSITYYCSVICEKLRNKREQETWRIECEYGIISDPDCPIDGGWTSWGSWSSCHGSCDEVGQRRRVRECINPPTKNDGIMCNGPDQQTETCYPNNCTVSDYRFRIKGNVARMIAFNQLEAVPALLERCLLMECTFEAIETALLNDNTWQLRGEVLWNALQCVKYNVGCDVRGAWSAWGQWSPCSARCGRGLRWRLRRCDAPPPSASNLLCVGVPVQSEPCEGTHCALDTAHIKDVGGAWGAWQPWSSCSETCGIGVRRRRRTCYDNRHEQDSDSWGTHCHGPHDQITICAVKDCFLNGGWTGWGSWSACSQTCGAGRKQRSRSCTRPSPAGTGTLCVGPRSEVEGCHLTPCQVYPHTVAVMHGESFLEYNFDKKRSRMLHFYLRFKPLSPHGTLVRRGAIENPLVQVSLQNWHVCVDTNGKVDSCSLPRICSPVELEPATWQTILVTITTQSVVLRIQDAQNPIKATFPCDPQLTDEKMNIKVGENLQGEIQDIIINFIPLKLRVDYESKGAISVYYPYAASNIAYEKANIEEAYLILDNNYFLRVPCCNEQEDWLLELTFKSKETSGTLIFLFHNALKNSLHMFLQNMRLKLRLFIGDLTSESTSFTDLPPDQWFDVTLLRKKESHTIVATINGREKIHVVIPSNNIESNNSYDMNPKRRKSRNLGDIESFLCDDEFYIAGVPFEIDSIATQQLSPFSGIIASFSINYVLMDLHSFTMENLKSNQLSSRTASVSGLYHETGWGKSNQLNLTCLYAKSLHSSYSAQWLYMDVAVNNVISEDTIQIVDNGRILKLVANAKNELRGFYTCRAHGNKRRRNVVTYGILGQAQFIQPGPDFLTSLTIASTLTLVIGTLIFLLIEGIRDLRNGYGFFRDHHLSPEDEAEAICDYIDRNLDKYAAPRDAEQAKLKARVKGQQTSRTNFAAQEPQGIARVERHLKTFVECSSSSEIDSLPDLPIENDAKNNTSYAFSSRVSSDGRQSIMSSFTMELPRSPLVCGGFLVSKKATSPRGRQFLKRGPRQRLAGSTKLLPVIKSSNDINLSPGQRVLQRFRQLKHNDIEV